MSGIDMHPDLKWLAESVSDWLNSNCNMLAKVDGHVQYVQGTGVPTDTYNGNPCFTYPQWLQARKDLGLIMSDEEEEADVPEWAGSVPEGVVAHDSVNKPKHYQLREGYEVYDLRQDLARKAEAMSVPLDEYSDWDRAMEYLIRMWDKNMLEDAKKSRWYLNKLIEKLEGMEL